MKQEEKIDWSRRSTVAAVYCHKYETTFEMTVRRITDLWTHRWDDQREFLQLSVLTWDCRPDVTDTRRLASLILRKRCIKCGAKKGKISVPAKDTEWILSLVTKSFLSQDAVSSFSNMTKSFLSKDTKSFLSKNTKSFLSNNTKSLLYNYTKSHLSNDTKSLLANDTRFLLSKDTKPFLSPWCDSHTCLASMILTKRYTTHDRTEYIRGRSSLWCDNYKHHASLILRKRRIGYDWSKNFLRKSCCLQTNTNTAHSYIEGSPILRRNHIFVGWDRQ